MNVRIKTLTDGLNQLHAPVDPRINDLTWDIANSIMNEAQVLASSSRPVKILQRNVLPTNVIEAGTINTNKD